MRLLLSVSLLFISGLVLTSCRVPNLNQTTTYTQASAQAQTIETESAENIVESTAVQSTALQSNIEKWNYAKLSIFTSQGQLQARWVTDEGITTATSGLLDLAQKIMGTLISDTDDSFIIFFNYLGNQGWELIQVRDIDRRSEYLFKQRDVSNQD